MAESKVDSVRSEEEKQGAFNTISEVPEGGRDQEEASQDDLEFDPLAYHERNAGRLVVDPE